MKLKIILTILSVLLLVSISGVWFYWSQWRPSEIRKVCVEEAVNKATKEPSEFLKSFSPKVDVEIKNEEATNFYRECLAKQGIKPESLFVK